MTLGKRLDFSVPWVRSSEENRELISSPLVRLLQVNRYGNASQSDGPSGSQLCQKQQPR